MHDNVSAGYAAELALAKEVAHNAGRLLMQRQATIQQIDFKGETDLVTDVDRSSEELIVGRIRESFPDDTIIAEEGSGSGLGTDTGRTWLIDPLDGTTNYAHGFPIYAVSIALVVNGNPAVGVVHVPALRETFAAERSKGATLNDEPIEVSATRELNQAIVASGFAYDPAVRMENMPVWAAFVALTRGVRRTGAAAFDLCCVASGRYDAYWEQGASAWDVAAGWLIVEEARGQVSDYAGEPLDMFGAEILASNRAIHYEMMRTIEQARDRLKSGTFSTLWDLPGTK